MTGTVTRTLEARERIVDVLPREFFQVRRHERVAEEVAVIVVVVGVVGGPVPSVRESADVVRFGGFGEDERVRGWA